LSNRVAFDGAGGHNDCGLSDIDKTIYPVYVVAGTDRRRAADSVAQIAEFALGDGDAQMALSSYEGPTASLAEVLDELRTLPLLAERRVVVIKDADAFIQEHRQSLEKYLQAPAPTAVLVLMAQSFAANTRLAKLAGKIGQVFRCGPMKPAELLEFVVRYAATSHRCVLSREATELLVELTGDEAGMLQSEIDKIATYLADREERQKQIGPHDVHAVVGANRHFSVFNVIDAMTAGKVSSALGRLDRMLAQDRNAEYTAVGAFAWHFRRLYNARLLLEKGTDQDSITRQLRVWSQRDSFMRQVKKLKLRDVAVFLRELMNIDVAAKTGAGTVKGGLEKLIVRFAGARRGAA